MTKAEVDKIFSVFGTNLVPIARRTSLRWVLQIDVRPTGQMEGELETWHGEKRISSHRTKGQFDEHGVFRRVS